MYPSPSLSDHLNVKSNARGTLFKRRVQILRGVMSSRSGSQPSTAHLRLHVGYLAIRQEHALDLSPLSAVIDIPRMELRNAPPCVAVEVAAYMPARASRVPSNQ
jgi:hypothetical protein